MSESTSATEAVPQPAAPARAIDWGAWAGVGFGVLVVVSGALDSSPDPTTKDAPKKWADWLADSGHRTSMFVSAELSVLGVALFLLFLHRLYLALAPSGEESASDRGLRLLAFASGAVFAGLVVVFTALGAAPALMEEFSDDYAADTGAALMLTAASILVFTLGSVTLSVLLWCVFVLSRRTGNLPSWLSWSALVVGVVLLGSFWLFGAPVLLFVVWVLVLSVLWLVRGRRG
ncbi:hypothetical protein [Yinghuangia seranimata]|uniref:hypothetical protein n=1 Tax=Yinghuangia seranimata TaxID=408067 RepID=UPI00248C34BC|nr:hypothetical protein [Yinghuangia seranimata]MDI2126071.1 hypothetical protein [Yinghuangia seranimata]